MAIVIGNRWRVGRVVARSIHPGSRRAIVSRTGSSIITLVEVVAGTDGDVVETIGPYVRLIWTR